MIRKLNKLVHLVQQKDGTNKRGNKSQGLEIKEKCEHINYKG